MRENEKKSLVLRFGPRKVRLIRLGCTYNLTYIKLGLQKFVQFIKALNFYYELTNYSLQIIKDSKNKRM